MEHYLAELLLKCKKKYDKQPAYEYCKDGEVIQISFAQFLEDVSTKKMGYAQMPQKRFGIYAYNSYEWIVAATALLLAGKTAILLDGNLLEENLEQLCVYTDMEYLITEDELWGPGTESREKFELKADKKEGEFICFTSGTSKSAKGVVISTKSLSACVDQCEIVLLENTADKYYLPLPYHHIYAFLFLFHLMNRGATICIGRMGRNLIQDLDTMNPQCAFFVPSILRYMVKKNFVPEKLKKIYTGGSQLSEDLGEQILNQGIELCNLYGASETLGAIGYSTAEKGTQWLRPVEGSHFLCRENGELGIAFLHHMDEYYKLPEETKAVLDREEHVYWTGDAARIDEDGYARILGRMRDMIVLENGEKVHAEDADAELSLLYGVEEAAVIGVEGKLMAILVIKSGSDEKEIRSALKKYNQKHPAAVHVSDVWIREEKLPRTTTGKLRRNVLEKEYTCFGFYRNRAADSSEA